MTNNQDPKKKSLQTDLSAELPEQLTAEAELLEQTFGAADTLEDFTKALVGNLTSTLQANIDEIFKNQK